MIKKILVADDEPLIREFIADYFASTSRYKDSRVDLASDGQEALDKIAITHYDLVFTDLKMPKKTGLEVTKFISERSPGTDTVLMTAYGSPDSAAKAMAWGAYEYLTKPVSVDELEMIVHHIFERQSLLEQNQALAEEVRAKTVFPKMVGSSRALTAVMDTVKMVAPTASTVLINGESGTGKELAAEALHRLSPRSNHPFIRLNCAALPEHLVESELFGFEKGAFTGAIKRTRGKFELADKGSILLDEISEMNTDLQVKLLRVIQEREFTPIGGETPVHTDVRIIATTNRDLAEEVKNGRFREDLFFRLNVVPMTMPPLRERREDIPLLVEEFTRRLSFDMGLARKAVTPSALALLMQYNWPGNIRQLQNAVERALVTCQGEVLDESSFAFLPITPAVLPVSEDVACFQTPDMPVADYVVIKNRTFADVEKEIIFKTLTATRNNKAEAARILGITSRTLRNKLKLYDEE